MDAEREQGLRLPYKGISPRVDESAFVAPNACLVGDVEVGPQSSLWFGVVARADVQPIRIGARVSVQDNAVIHATRGWAATEIGDDCTVGHGAILHGCKLDTHVLVGMGACILDGASIASEVLIGAGSLITANTYIPHGVLAMGSPAKVVRFLKDSEREWIRQSAQNYATHSEEYRAIVEASIHS